MTRLLAPLVTLGLFVALCSYCYPRFTSQPPVSEGEFVARRLAEYQPRDAGVVYRATGKTVYVWRDKKSAAVAEALSLTPTSIDDTVDVRGRR